MTEALSIYRAVLEQPHEYTPRSLLADYWEENGEQARAAFIRFGSTLPMQCAFHPIHDCTPLRRKCYYCKHRQPWGTVVGGLKKMPVWDGWSFALAGIPSRVQTPVAVISQGFVEQVNCTLPEWERLASVVLWDKTKPVSWECQPITEVVLLKCSLQQRTLRKRWPSIETWH